MTTGVRGDHRIGINGFRLDDRRGLEGQPERWRKIRPRGTRIPEELWQAATEVGCEVGVPKTAQAPA